MQTASLLLAALLLAGCVVAPVPVRCQISPKMATAYANGKMTITWKAESNQLYTIYYTETSVGKRTEWIPLPQAKGLCGRGETMTITDQVQSESQRRYLLLEGDQKPF